MDLSPRLKVSAAAAQAAAAPRCTPKGLAGSRTPGRRTRTAPRPCTRALAAQHRARPAASATVPAASPAPQRRVRKREGEAPLASPGGGMARARRASFHVTISTGAGESLAFT
jgi:hypothetical protein